MKPSILATPFNEQCDLYSINRNFRHSETAPDPDIYSRQPSTEEERWLVKALERAGDRARATASTGEEIVQAVKAGNVTATKLATAKGMRYATASTWLIRLYKRGHLSRRAVFGAHSIQYVYSVRGEE